MVRYRREQAQFRSEKIETFKTYYCRNTFEKHDDMKIENSKICENLQVDAQRYTGSSASLIPAMQFADILRLLTPCRKRLCFPV
jgi:hypothetical protein